MTDKNGNRMKEMDRIRDIIHSLRTEYYETDDFKITNVSIREGKYTFAQRFQGDWRPFDTEKETWGKPDTYFWFKLTAVVPENMDGKELWYAIHPREDGGFDWGNPQGLLYVNGEPLQALDSNHSTVKLSQKCKAGDVYDIYYSAYTDKLFFKTPLRFKNRLVTVDPSVLKLYWDLRVPFEVAKLLNIDDYRRYDIINSITEAINLLDLRNGYGPEFCTSLAKAQEWFSEEFYGRYACKSEDVLATLVGHTHIDVAWLWDLAQTRDKAERTFTTIVHMMDEYPDFIFMSSQPQLYAFIKEEHPELFEKIRAMVKEGRWEAEGGMWLEADTNLPSGESLVRQFLHGKRFFQKEFGVDNRILWLPDVFGYSAALPQIMKKSGIDYFMTTKISWNEYNKLPYDTFIWRGIDGSEVLTHFIPTMDYSDTEKGWMSTYNGNTSPSQVMGGWQRYQQKDLNRNFLISYGHGDGGGGPTPDMIECARRLVKGVPGCPRAELSNSRAFFERLEKDVTGKKNLPRWVGELYFEHHRGTYTSIGKTKKYNRKAEVLLHDTEWFHTMAAVTGTSAEYPADLLDKAWKTVLLNQFHDILPGSSIKEVYDQSWTQYEEMFAEVKPELDKALRVLAEELAPREGGITVFNPAPVNTSGPVFIDDLPPEVESVIDAFGRISPVQRTFDGRRVFFAEDVPAGGAKTYTFNEKPVIFETLLDAGETHLENEYISVLFDDKMEIVSLKEKKSGEDLVPAGESINRLIVYEDVDDAWDIRVYFKDKCWPVDRVESSQLLENGPCRAVLRVIRRFEESVITQDIILYDKAKRLDVENRIDWKQRNCLLKAEFPVPVNAVKAAFDIQFGNLERSTHENTLWDFAQFEVCANKWADISDYGRGLSLLNDCKYGYNVKDNKIALSLLRGTSYPNEEAYKEVHEFTYSLYPHPGEWRQAETAEQAYALNFPFHSVMSAGLGKAATAEWVKCDAPNVFAETAKLAEDRDGWILRLYEYKNQKADFILTLPRNLQSAEIVDLMEHKEQEAEFLNNTIRLSIKPYEILTVKLVFTSVH